MSAAFPGPQGPAPMKPHVQMAIAMVLAGVMPLLILGPMAYYALARMSARAEHAFAEQEEFAAKWQDKSHRLLSEQAKHLARASAALGRIEEAPEAVQAARESVEIARKIGDTARMNNEKFAEMKEAEGAQQIERLRRDRKQGGMLLLMTILIFTVLNALLAFLVSRNIRRFVEVARAQGGGGMAPKEIADALEQLAAMVRGGEGGEAPKRP